ncbi:hypothetical protein [Microbulbifer sp. ALW1]|uniref:hypothetical protein n=1 Tax=Microbulbifer sp. (strain ALW1) TaxID=1516059 RepID=UPI00135B530A|nr:hypothetical protein [Microbulbifer sp. ALW1]
MTSDIYQAPEADLRQDTDQGQAVAAEDREFYVVSGRKFLVLMIGTFGLYELYWAYRHWKNYSDSHRAAMWPVMRAIFFLFFAHSLCSKIDASLLSTHKKHSWSPTLVATLYVVFSLVSSIGDRLSGMDGVSIWVSFVAFGVFPVLIWCLYRIQVAANIACDDPQASSNASFTPANFIWLAIGFAIWAALLFGLYAAYVGLPY